MLVQIIIYLQWKEKKVSFGGAILDILQKIYSLEGKIRLSYYDWLYKIYCCYKLYEEYLGIIDYRMDQKPPGCTQNPILLEGLPILGTIRYLCLGWQIVLATVSQGNERGFRSLPIHTFTVFSLVSFSSQHLSFSLPLSSPLSLYT